MTTIALHNQNLLDISIQHTGTVENCFIIAVANGLCISDDLIPGQKLIIPDDVVINNEILNYYTAKEIQPATAYPLSVGEEIEEQSGIGYMQIGSTFKVS